MFDAVVARIEARHACSRAEAERIAAIKLRCAVPSECGPDIIAAPARGAFATFTPRGVLAGSNGSDDEGYHPQGEEYPRKALRVADVFDRMEADARKRKKPMPVTRGQVNAARWYRDLVERHDAGGMRCTSLEAMPGGSGSGRCFMDDFVAEGRELERLRARIGTGVAMAVRRVRPSARGAGARTITDRALVDAVCLGDMTVTEVLGVHGWSARGENIKTLVSALCEVLERMR
ncbi:hypothetical protein ERN12_05995 [Rhodobacteraceae bacterium]|nr:hypothetical protein ERN12_05995 [Paracoccaceae bacterium]